MFGIFTILIIIGVALFLMLISGYIARNYNYNIHISTLNRINDIGKFTAITSFIAGTFVFLLHEMERSDFNLIFGLWFVIILVSVNLIIWIVVLITSLISRKQRKKSLTTAALMLLNIPVAIIYFLMVFKTSSN